MAKTSNKFNITWFKEKCKEQNLSQTELAKELGLAPSGLTHVIKGRRKLKAQEAPILARLFRCPIEEVLSNAGFGIQGLEARSLDVGGYVDGRLNIHLGKISGPKKAPFVEGQDIKVLRLQTTGTRYEGMDGCLVYYREESTVNLECLGKISVVRVQGEKDLKLRILKKGYEPGAFNLLDLNGELLESNIIAKSSSLVLWMKF